MPEAAAPAPPPAPATQTMYGADGAPVEVPLAQVANAYRSGQLAFAGDAPVVVDRGGRLEQLSGDEAGQLLEGPRGASVRLATPGAYQEQQERAEYETLGHKATTGLAGAARGLTGGLSDPALVALGGEGVRERLAKDQRYNPGTALAGEGVGMLAPLLLPGVGEAELAAEGTNAARGGGFLSRLGQLAAAPTRGAGIVGEGFGGLARAGVEGLGAAEGGALSGFAHTAAQGAAEGALYGAGSAASEATLANEDITSQKLLAGAGMGALLGGGSGVGLSMLGALGRGAVRKGSEAAGGLLERLGTTEAKVAAHEGQVAGELAEKSPLAQWGDEFAQRKAIQSTGANQRQHEVLERMGPEVKATVAKQMFDDLPALEGKSSLATMSHRDIARAAEKNAQKWGEDIGARLKQLDEHAPAVGPQIRPDIEAVVQRAKKEILEPLLNTPFADKEAKAIGKEIASFEKKAGTPSFSELQEMRVRLDKTINYEAAEHSPTEQAKIALRRILEDEILNTGEKAAKDVGSEFAAGYRQAKAQYRAAKWVEEASAKGATAEARNRTTGLSELVGQLSGGNAGSTAGATLGGAIAGPLGATVLGGIGHVVGAAAGAAWQNLVRRYGDQVAATVASRAVKTDLVRAVSQTVDEHLDHGIGKFLGGKGAKGLLERAGQTPLRTPGLVAIDREETRRAHEERTRAPEKTFAATKADLSAFLASPQPRLDAATAPLQGAPSTLVAAVQKRALSAAQFLQSKLPPAGPASLTPQLDKDRTSPAAQAKWLRYVRAVDDPMTVVDDLEHGRLSRESVEAVKAVYPDIYKGLQTRVLEQLSQAKAPVDYAKRLQLGILLDVPTDPSLKPAFLQLYQPLLASAGQPGAQGAGPAKKAGGSSSGPKKPITTFSTFAETKAGSIEAAGEMTP